MTSRPTTTLHSIQIEKLFLVLCRPRPVAYLFNRCISLFLGAPEELPHRQLSSTCPRVSSSRLSRLRSESLFTNSLSCPTSHCWSALHYLHQRHSPLNYSAPARSCHEEGSSVLDGKNVFSVDMRHSYESEVTCQIEELIRRFELLGKNVDLIRNLQANLDATPTLNRMQSIRGFRRMLQNLDFLKITFSEHPRVCGIYYILPLSRLSGGAWHRVDLHAWLKVTRRLFQNLNYIFMERNPCPVNMYATGYTLILHLLSNNVKVELSVKSP